MGRANRPSAVACLASRPGDDREIDDVFPAFNGRMDLSAHSM